MTGSNAGGVEPEEFVPHSGENRMECGTCRDPLVIGKGQLLEHADGTPVCDIGRWDLQPSLVGSKLVREVEAAEERERRRADGWGVAVLFLTLVALLVGCFAGVAMEWPR